MLAYWKLLMRDRLMALRPGSRRREGQAAWKALLGWAGMALLFVILYGMAIIFEMLMYDQARAMGEPQAVIALAFLACTLMTLIYSFFYVISLLFFGRDCAFVGALPIPSHGVLMAKLATVLAGEAGLTVLVCLPLLVRYGVEMGMGADFYVRSLLGVLLVPGIPVAITTLLAFGLIRISALWKRREGVTTVMTFVLVAAIVGAELALEPETVEALRRAGLFLPERADFNPIREHAKPFRTMTEEEREQAIAKDPRYGRIICRCETVTEAEIAHAIERTLGKPTVDGVKRRTRAGMGRCQGGFCAPRVMELIEKYGGIPMEKITKNGGASRMIVGRTRQEER